MKENKIDYMWHGEFENGLGQRITPEDNRSFERFFDYLNNSMFAAGAGMTYLAYKAAPHISDQDMRITALGVGGLGLFFGVWGFSQRLTSAAMRYAANRGTYSSLLDVIKRV